MLPYSITLILYNFFLFYFVPYITVPANSLRLGLTPGQVTQVGNYWTTWQTYFSNYMNPLTYGPINTATLNGLYVIILPYIGAIQQQIKNNPTVTLTPLEYVILAIHKNLERRSNIAKPTAEPIVAVKGNTHFNTEFLVFDTAHPTHAAKPKDVTRITPFMLLLPAGSPLPTDDDMIEQADVTRMVFDVPFVAAQLDMDGYMQVCFTNDAGQGPRSPIIPFSII